MYPTISDDPVTQAEYEALRAAGESHGIAAILATGKCPGIRTDATYFAGRSVNQFKDNEHNGRMYLENARRAGIDTTGLTYISQLQRPGMPAGSDPEAWIRSKGDIAKVCRQRNWSCQGEVTVKQDGRKDEPPIPSVDIAPDILQREVRRAIAQDPGQQFNPHLAEEVKERITPNWKKGTTEA